MSILYCTIDLEMRESRCEKFQSSKKKKTKNKPQKVCVDLWISSEIYMDGKKEMNENSAQGKLISEGFYYANITTFMYVYYIPIFIFFLYFLSFRVNYII